MSELSRRTDKPICIVWHTEWLEGPGAAPYENDKRVALFRSSRRCFATLAGWEPHDELRRSPAEPTTRTSPRTAEPEASRALAAAGERLTEREAKAVLAIYGIPVT